VLVVEDVGVGFEVSEAQRENRGIGLAGMQERAALVGANLHIESAPGKDRRYHPLPGVGAGGRHVMIRVLLAEDHETVREGLRLLVNAQPDMQVVAEVSDGRRRLRVDNADSPTSSSSICRCR